MACRRCPPPVMIARLSQMSLPEPPRLLERCRNGDQAAWARLVDQYAGLVFSIARKQGLPRELCDDVAQIVFATLARQVGNIRDEASLPGWLGTVARRESWRAKRGLARRRGEELPLSETLAAEDAELRRAEQILQVRTLLRRLDGNCRALLEALFLVDPEPTYEEVAQQVGIPIGSIGPTRRRCLAKLLDRMRGEERFAD